MVLSLIKNKQNNMNNTKLLVGLGLGAAALYLIFKPKGTSNPCKEGEELVTEIISTPCMPSPDGDTSNCKSYETKVCKPTKNSNLVTNDKPQLEEVLINAQVSAAPSSEFSGGFKNYVSSNMMFGLHPFFSNADGGFKNYVSGSFFNSEKQKLNY